MESAKENRNHGTRSALRLGILLLTGPGLAFAQAAPGGCSLDVSAGRDYRPGKYVQENTYKSHGVLLKLVEDAHFTAEVETLRHGKIGIGPPGGDIAYTLRVYPNHHRALIAMVALGEKEKTYQPNGSEHSVECWLQRAVAFRPDDNMARMLYGQYLIKSKRADEAAQQLSVAATQAGDNAFTQHNVGLLYFDMKEYDKALLQAHKAYELGFGAATLRDRLKSVGKWSEPAQAVPVEAAKSSQ